MKKLILILLTLVVIICCIFFYEKTVKSSYYVPCNVFDGSGKNLSSPFPLYLARKIQLLAERKKLGGAEYSNKFFKEIFNGRLAVSPYFEDENYSRYCKLLKVDSNYYEVLVYPVEKKGDTENYFICTPSDILKIDFRKVENDEQIINISGNDYY